MAILFKPVFDFDHTIWAPAIQKHLSDLDVRIWPDIGDPHDIHYIIAWKPDESWLTDYSNLKAVLALSAGINHYIGHRYMPANTPLVRMIEDGMTQGMVEYVVSMVLRLHRRHDEMNRDQVAKHWNPVIPPLSKDTRVGILGLGELGQACAKALTMLGFQVSGWSRSHKAFKNIDCFSGMDSMPQFLSNLDYLVCLLPLTHDTAGLINKNTLGMLPKGASIINPSRGGLIVDDDLLEHLNKGHIQCAVLDVFHEEPLPKDHPFWDHRGVIITPHIAAATYPDTAMQALRESIGQLENNEQPRGLVDFTRGY